MLQTVKANIFASFAYSTFKMRTKKSSRKSTTISSRQRKTYNNRTIDCWKAWAYSAHPSTTDDNLQHERWKNSSRKCNRKSKDPLVYTTIYLVVWCRCEAFTLHERRYLNENFQSLDVFHFMSAKMRFFPRKLWQANSSKPFIYDTIVAPSTPRTKHSLCSVDT